MINNSTKHYTTTKIFLGFFYLLYLRNMIDEHFEKNMDPLFQKTNCILYFNVNIQIPFCLD